MREDPFASLSGARALAVAVPLAGILAGGLIAALARILIIRTV
jgi:hypothetical protein